MKYLTLVLFAALVLSITDAAAQIARASSKQSKPSLTYFGCLKALRASEGAK